MFNELLENVMNLGIITEDDVKRLTAIELMLLIIERTNGLLNHVEMIDEKLDKTEEMIDEKLVKVLENIRTTTIEELNKWTQDGTFDRLINQSALKKVNERIDETNAQLTDINFLPQAPLPAKIGEMTNSNKLVIKNNNNSIDVVQRTNLGYLWYTFNTVDGDTSAASVGVNHELIRLKRVKHMTDCIVWYEPELVTGAITASIQPSEFNNVESAFVIKCDKENLTNKTGLGLYDLPKGQTVTYKFRRNKNQKIRLHYLAQNNRSNSIKLYVDNTLVKEFSSVDGSDSSVGGSYKFIEIDVPNGINNTSVTFNLKIENAGAEKFSFVGFNIYKLDEHDGQLINSYKVYGNSKEFINNAGANDYAIFDKDIQKWCGSYHGGEKRETCKIDWINNTYENNEDLIDLINLENVASSFCVIKNLKIIQKTNINNKCNMSTVYDFNCDGTLHMLFGLANNTINCTQLYTALTCTKPEFDYTIHPDFYKVEVDADTPVKIHTGMITQHSLKDKLDLTIRFNIFNSEYNKLGTYIRRNDYYSKFYYGIVTGYDEGIRIPNLSFSKALDFYVHKI